MADLAEALATSRAHDLAVHALSNVPGLPPILQTVHLLCIAVVMGSIVLLSLRVVGIAVPSQEPNEMASRLAPWFWSALPLLFLSGFVFVLARPQRYFANPVFGYKFAMLAVSIVLTVLLLRRVGAADPSAKVRVVSRMLAVCTLLLWIGVVLAGRWIAYADYLFPPE